MPTPISSWPAPAAPSRQASNSTSAKNHLGAPKDQTGSRRNTPRTESKSYTVQIQNVVVKKKKTTYLDCLTTVPPEGYTYLPVGFLPIKERCKERCLREERLYYVVSLFRDPSVLKRHRPDSIFRNMHRFGWHFPNDITFEALQHFGLTDVRQIHAFRNPLAVTSNPPPHLVTEVNLRSIIKDLFSKMPEEDINLVIQWAFKSGTKRVGNAEDMAFPRRAQLAVLAHIRHNHTNYDDLLKSKVAPREVIRVQIEPKCLRFLLQWRGEDEVDFEERTEEVIIIDDDKEVASDDDLLDDFDYSSRRGHDPDVEIVRWNHLGRSKELQANELPTEFFAPKMRGVVGCNRGATDVQHTFQPPHLNQNAFAYRTEPSHHAHHRPKRGPLPSLVYDAKGRPFEVVPNAPSHNPPSAHQMPSVPVEPVLPSIESAAQRPAIFGNGTMQEPFTFEPEHERALDVSHHRYHLRPRLRPPTQPTPPARPLEHPRPVYRARELPLDYGPPGSDENRHRYDARSNARHTPTHLPEQAPPREYIPIEPPLKRLRLDDHSVAYPNRQPLYAIIPDPSRALPVQSQYRHPQEPYLTHRPNSPLRHKIPAGAAPRVIPPYSHPPSNAHPPPPVHQQHPHPHPNPQPNDRIIIPHRTRIPFVPHNGTVRAAGSHPPQQRRK